ncbi:MAG: LexA family protein [Anaerolineae bacterium]
MPSPLQSAVLVAIQASLRDRGYPPTIREICATTGMTSTAHVRYHLVRLEHAGIIRRDRDVARGIVLLKDRAA